MDAESGTQARADDRARRAQALENGMRTRRRSAPAGSAAHGCRHWTRTLRAQASGLDQHRHRQPDGQGPGQSAPRERLILVSRSNRPTGSAMYFFSLSTTNRIATGASELRFDRPSGLQVVSTRIACCYRHRPFTALSRARVTTVIRTRAIHYGVIDGSGQTALHTRAAARIISMPSDSRVHGESTQPGICDVDHRQ